MGMRILCLILLLVEVSVWLPADKYITISSNIKFGGEKFIQVLAYDDRTGGIAKYIDTPGEKCLIEKLFCLPNERVLLALLSYYPEGLDSELGKVETLLWQYQLPDLRRTELYRWPGYAKPGRFFRLDGRLVLQGGRDRWIKVDLDRRKAEEIPAVPVSLLDNVLFDGRDHNFQRSMFLKESKKVLCDTEFPDLLFTDNAETLPFSLPSGMQGSAKILFADDRLVIAGYGSLNGGGRSWFHEKGTKNAWQSLPSGYPVRSGDIVFFLEGDPEQKNNRLTGCYDIRTGSSRAYFSSAGFNAEQGMAVDCGTVFSLSAGRLRRFLHGSLDCRWVPVFIHPNLLYTDQQPTSFQRDWDTTTLDYAFVLEEDDLKVQTERQPAKLLMELLPVNLYGGELVRITLEVLDSEDRPLPGEMVLLQDEFALKTGQSGKVAIDYNLDLLRNPDRHLGTTIRAEVLRAPAVNAKQNLPCWHLYWGGKTETKYLSDGGHNWVSWECRLSGPAPLHNLRLELRPGDQSGGVVPDVFSRPYESPVLPVVELNYDYEKVLQFWFKPGLPDSFVLRYRIVTDEADWGIYEIKFNKYKGQ